jgi:hypothetical protein
MEFEKGEEVFVIFDSVLYKGKIRKYNDKDDKYRVSNDAFEDKTISGLSWSIWVSPEFITRRLLYE